jgi:hypothetical protein
MAFCFTDIVSGPVSAQQGVSMQFIMPANPSPYFSDWNDGSIPVRLIVANESENTYFAQFAFKVLKDDRTVIRTNVEYMPVEMIPPGVIVFEAIDVIVYDALVFAGGFEEGVAQTGKLPAGLYQVCIELFEVEYQSWWPGIVCQTVVVSDYQPPRLIQADRLEIYSGQIPLFNFTPVVPPVNPGSSMYPVTYRLVVMEVFEDQTEMDAFLSNMPVMELFLENQTRIFWPPDFEPPEPGRKYVWNVQAIDGMDNPIGQNEGWAEPKAFSVTDRMIPIPEFYNLSLMVVGADGERMREAYVVLYNREYPLGDHVFELPPGRHQYTLIAEGKSPARELLKYPDRHQT